MDTCLNPGGGEEKPEAWAAFSKFKIE